MSSILTIPARAATKAVDDTAQKDALIVIVPNLEETIDEVGQIDPMGIGSTVTQPTIPAQPSIFSQCALPSLPAPLETTSTAASGVTSTTARDDTEADNPEVKEDEPAVHVTKPEEAVVVHENADSAITAATIAELKCPYVNCKYVTAIGQDCIKYGMESYMTEYMKQELKFHSSVHHVEDGDANGNVAVATIPVENGVYDDAAANVANEELHNFPVSWSKKSRKRNKSRRSDADYSGMIWDGSIREIC